MRIDVEACGRLPYDRGLALQERVHADVAAGHRAPTVLLLEHDPVVTLGRRGRAEHLLRSAAWYAERGVAVRRVDRGGEATYHGPGQLVGYAIVPVGRRVRALVASLQWAIVEVAARFDVAADPRERPAGVWVADDKLCAVGLAVREGVSYHGFALNVSTELDAFDAIVPCGLEGRGVTSLARASGRTDVSFDAVLRATGPALERAFSAWRAEPVREVVACRA